MRFMLRLATSFALGAVLVAGASFLLPISSVQAQPVEEPVRDRQIENCHADNDDITVSLPEEEGWTFTDTGWVDGNRTITKIFPGDPPVTFVYDYVDENSPCPVSPFTPLQTEVCGPNNDIIDPSRQPEGIVVVDDTFWTAGIRIITFGTADGYVLTSGNREVTYGFNDFAIPCEVDPPAIIQSIVCGPNNDELTWDAGGLTVDDSGWIDGRRQVGFLVQPETEQWLYQGFWDDDTLCIDLPESVQTVVCGPNNDEITVDRTGFSTIDAGWIDGERVISFSVAGTGQAAGSLAFTDHNTPCDSPDTDDITDSDTSPDPGNTPNPDDVPDPVDVPDADSSPESGNSPESESSSTAPNEPTEFTHTRAQESTVVSSLPNTGTGSAFQPNTGWVVGAFFSLGIGVMILWQTRTSRVLANRR